MKLSENHLFHFTHQDALLSIIDEGFIPFFGWEVTELDDYGKHPIRIEKFPRVCFTDLPLNLIKEHTEKYDRFAIGMNKRWAIQNGLNPLLYIQKNSIIGSTLSMLTESLIEYHETLRNSNIRSYGLETILQRLADLNHMLGRYTKPYEVENDQTITHSESLEEIKILAARYYDEREWRFVPLIKVEELINENVWPVLTASNDDLNRISRKYTRTFELNDIVSIVVPEESKKELIANHLADRFNRSTAEIEDIIEFIYI